MDSILLNLSLNQNIFKLNVKNRNIVLENGEKW